MKSWQKKGRGSNFDIIYKKNKEIKIKDKIIGSYTNEAKTKDRRYEERA